MRTPLLRLCFATAAIAVTLDAQTPDRPRRAVIPKALVNALPIAPEQVRVVVKLVEGRPTLPAPGRLLDPEIAAVLGERPLTPFFRGLADELAAIRARQLAAAPGTTPPVDLGLYFEVTTADAGDTRALVQQLNALPTVEIAYARELPAPPPGDVPPFTPDFTANQGYRAAAPGGIDALAMASVTGANGTGVRVLDIEWGWDFGHEDIAALLASSLVGPPIGNPSYNNHGTAVGGMLAADADGHGVTGLVPAITLRVATDFPAAGYSVANAIVVGLPVLQSGDVMLLEAQTSTPVGLGPTEWVQADFDAILVATTLGIVTVEAGGNGGGNLDSPSLGGLFNIAVRDSGAILVGASNGPALTRASFSTWGSRINANGWGSGVATTGYGGLFSAPGSVLQNYTATFNGTSSASPMVTAAVVALRGAAAAQLAPAAAQALGPFAIRALLSGNGTPVPDIGRRPDARAQLTAAGILRGLSLRNEAATGQSCWLDLVPPFAATAADLWGLFGGPTPANAPLAAPFEPTSRLLLDLATAVPVAAGTLGTLPATHAIVVPLTASLVGQSLHFQALTLQTASGVFRASNAVRLFLRI